MARKRKKPPQGEFEATIDTLSHDGRGIAKLDGKVTFIDNALQGETVKFHYLKTNRQWDEGQATTILKASDDRSEPICPYYSQCGGCSLQHLSSQSQLQLKQNTLLEQLQHFAGTSPQSILPPVTGPTNGYRAKARLGVRYVNKKGPVLVGFREKFSNFITDMQHCPILTPEVDGAIGDLRDTISDLSIYNAIPQIEVASAQNTTALIIRHLQDLTEADYVKLKSLAQRHHFTIYLQPKGPDTIHPLDPGQDPWLYYQLPAFNLTFYFKATDFTQVNTSMNQKLVSLAYHELQLEPNDHVLDLFCGLGNFSLPIAQTAQTVTGIEGNEAMVNRAYMNAHHNDLNNVTFLQSDLTEPLNQQSWLHPYNKLLIDPPRSGAEAIVNNIDKLDVKRIVYVSCNPATLARDSYQLTQHGYQLLKAGVLDMFPHTSHVESIAVFEK